MAALLNRRRAASGRTRSLEGGCLLSSFSSDEQWREHIFRGRRHFPLLCQPDETPGRRGGGRLGNGGLGGGHLCLLVHQDDDAGQSRSRCQHPQFVQAAFVLGDEIAQVHQHDIAGPDQRGQRLLPGRVVAVAFIDPVTSLDIGKPFEFRQPARDVGRGVDEALAEAAVDEGEDVVGIDGPSSSAGA